jgi:hypothetical protein
LPLSLEERALARVSKDEATAWNLTADEAGAAINSAADVAFR